jgi:lysophospholipase L1-like esterase
MTKLVAKLNIVLMAVVAILLVVVSSAGATTPKKLIFQAWNTSSVNIWSADPNGDSPVDLTEDASSDVQPAWSAAANKIAFVSDRSGGEKIFTMNPDGSEVSEALTSGSSSFPAWSPDGTKIAYAYGGHLHVMNANGSSDHQVGSDTNVGHITWSPDESTIAYTLYISSTDSINKISASASSGTAGTVLTERTTEYIEGYPYASNDETPAWSPDGTKIAFLSNRDTYGHYDLFTMNTSGGALKDLTRNTGHAHDDLATWAPAGGLLYFTDNNGFEVVNSSETDPYKTLLAAGSGYNDASYQQPPLPTVPPTEAHYVALGDSVAAGEGINYGWEWESESKSWSGGETSPSWMSDQYSIDNQHCHQSLSGYPTLLRQHLEITTEDFSDFACSGASAENGVLKNQVFGDSTTTSEPQLGSTKPGYENANVDYDNAEPDVVTLTLGANDVHFTDFMNACYGFSVPGFECNTGGANSAISGYLASQQSELETVLTEIQNRGIEDGHIPLVVVTTYYNPFPSSYNAECPDLVIAEHEGVGFDLSSGEMGWLTSKLGELNQNIIKVASMFSNVAIVPLEDVMEGHGFCSSDPWIYGVSLRIGLTPSPHLNESPAPFHPTAVGQEKIAERIETATG